MWLWVLACGACTSEDGGDDDVGVDTAPAPLRALVSDPTSLDLGTHFVGDTVTGEVLLENVGDATLDLAPVAAGAAAAAYSFSLTTESLAVGERATLTVTLAPTAWGDAGIVVGFTPASLSVPIFAAVQEDADGDGFGSRASRGTDCDDTRADVYPGAPDDAGDGLDSDCAADDEGDADGDGWPDALDCDDESAAVYPGAPDAWYDGVDGNCAGDADDDQDADGAPVGEDCDDTDVSVGVPTTEAWNGRDDDCDGGADDLDIAVVADGVLYGGIAGQKVGNSHALAFGGDVDGDGADDLLAVTSFDNVGWLVGGADAIGASGRIDDTARAVFEGSNTLYPLAYVGGAMRDLTGDGTPDPLLGGAASRYGYGWLVDGAGVHGTTLVENTYTARFAGDATADGLTWSLAGDIDGDGVPEVVTGARYDAYTGSGTAADAGSVAVFHSTSGRFDGAYDLGDADDRIYGSFSSDSLGYSLTLGDLDGDGYTDLVAGASGYDAGASEGGAVFVFSGQASLSWADRAADAARVTVLGTTAAGGLGTDPLPSLGDLDGDGTDDLTLTGIGVVRVFFHVGGLGSTVDDADADTTLSGSAGSFATAAAAAADLDGDGTDDLVLGAAGDDTRAVDSGAVFVFYGDAGWSAGMSASDADVSLYGNSASDGLGAAVATGGDADGDGHGDLVLGAPGVDTGAIGGGAAYLLLGR